MSESSDRGARVRARAVEILAEVERGSAFASALLERYEPEFADPRDRALLHETVLGTIRRLPVLDDALADLARRPPERLEPVVRAAVRVGLHALLYLDRVPDHAAVHSAVEAVRRLGAPRATGFVNAVLRRASRDRERFLAAAPREGDAQSLARITGHPEWWTRRLIRRVGWERAVRVTESDNVPACTSARVRRGREPDAVLEALAKDDVAAIRSPLLPHALRVRSGSVVDSGPFRDGALYIQDEAAQLVALLAGRPPEGPILDCCAAPGGKSIQLAELAGPGVAVLALDRSARRLQRLVENVTRTRSDDVLAVRADVDVAIPPVVERSMGTVLLDAPCSATGTFRRHPEIRWRLRPEQLSELSMRQSRMLRRAWRCVRPGGRLVYAVCSMEPEEGEQVVDPFVESTPDCVRADPTPFLPVRCRGWVGRDLALRTGPDEGIDGFYAVALDRHAP